MAAGVTAVVILSVILIARRYGPETLSHREKQVIRESHDSKPTEDSASDKAQSGQ